MTLELDPDMFRAFIEKKKKFYSDAGSYVSVIVLADELEDPITNRFFQGKLSDLVTYNTDRHGKLRMYLAGVKTMFTDKLTPEHSMWVLDGQMVDVPSGTVTPKPGPGAPPNGGTPIAASADVLRKAA